MARNIRRKEQLTLALRVCGLRLTQTRGANGIRRWVLHRRDWGNDRSKLYFPYRTLDEVAEDLTPTNGEWLYVQTCVDESARKEVGRTAKRAGSRIADLMRKGTRH